MPRWRVCLATAALVLATGGVSSAQPPPSAEDVAHWGPSQRAAFNASFDKSTHDACVTSAETHGAPADVAGRYCTCVVTQLQPLSVEAKLALPQHREALVAAANTCKAR
jgi:hypothetical protein